MTDRPIQPVSPLPADPSLSASEVSRLAVSAGSAVRMLADGEADAAGLSVALRPELVAELMGEADASVGSDGDGGDAAERLSARVDYEVALRGSVSRIMGSDRAPAGLRSAVVAAMRSEPVGTAGQGQGGAVPLNAGGRSRSRSFWNRAAGWMAVAAVLGLAGVGIFNGIRATSSQDGFSSEYRQTVVNFVAQVHNACDRDDSPALTKFTAHCIDSAESVTNEVLGTMPDGLCGRLRGLEGLGYEFVGLGRCGVPGDGASVHALLRTPSGQRASLFVQVAHRDATIRSTCRYTSDRCAKSGSQMTVWRSERFIYYFYSTDDEARATIVDAFGVPAENRAL